MSDRLGHGHTAYDLLVSEGAPELPADHFYRIKQETHSDHAVRVEVRKVASRLGSDRISWSVFSTREGGTAVDAAVRACSEAFDDAFPEGVPA